MKILYAIQGVERSSGVSLFVVEMLKQLVDMGHECALLYSTIFEVGDLLPQSVTVVHSDCVAAVLAQSRYDIVHMHGLWSPFNRRVMAACLSAKVPYVVSPHGCLMPTAMRKGLLKKTVFYFAFLRPLLNKAKCIHVTTEMERNACLRIGVHAPMAVVPLGANVEPLLDLPKEKIVLTLSRISPEKGIDDLLKRWSEIPHDGWQLFVAGPSWRGHGEELERMVAEKCIEDVRFTGPVYGDEKRRLYAHASIFVMSSYTENFGGTVLEAMTEETPVVATTDVAWQALESRHCGWWVERAKLADVLRSAMGESAKERLEMGRRGREYVTSEYSWQKVADKMVEKYNDL